MAVQPAQRCYRSPPHQPPGMKSLASKLRCTIALVVICLWGGTFAANTCSASDIFDVPGALRRLAQQEAQATREARKQVLTPAPQINADKPRQAAPIQPQLERKGLGTEAAPLTADPKVSVLQAEAAHYFHNGVAELLTHQRKKAVKIAEHLAELDEDPAANAEGKIFSDALWLRIHHVEARQSLLEKTLETLPTPEALATKSFACQLAVADGLSRLGPMHAPPALEIYNRVGLASHALSRVFAAEGMSDALVSLNRFDQAYDWIRFSIQTLDDLPKAGITTRRRAYDFRQELDAQIASQHRERLIAKRDEIEVILSIIKYGLGFALYEGAQKARFADQNETALRLYDQIIELADRNKNSNMTAADVLQAKAFDPEALLRLPISDVYAEASRFYRLECMARTGNFAKAYAGLGLYTKNNPFRLYTAEAYILMGDIALEEGQAPTKAMRHYTQAIDWCSSIRKSDRNLDRFQVPSKAESVTAAPKEMKGSAGWGNIVWREPKPGAIVNRQTTPWYLDYQRMMAQTRRSLCHFMLGQEKLALADIEIITEVDEADRAMTVRNMPSNYLRLRDGYKAGRLYATKPELAQFPPERRALLMIAEFYFEMEQWDEALRRYRSLQKRFDDVMSFNEKAYLEYAIGAGACLSGDAEQGKTILERFMKDEYANTPSWPRAITILADLVPGIDQKAKLLRSVYKRNSNNDLGKRALMYLGQHYYSADKIPEAREAFIELASVAKGTWMEIGAKNFLRHMEK